ncbi:SirB2 family protein [Hydrogenophaga sp.]|uniref:SirB2 family protein n=1 Tax=Hydrogenophaga sp. TaxID=1904254 RepID=UPI003564F532
MLLAHFYPYIKHAHIGLAITSGALFALRGLGVLAGLQWPMRTGMRQLSMGIDTLLLLAALLLLAVLHLNPFATPWLLAKLGLLVAYIVLGSFALKRAKSWPGRALAYAAALLCFAAIYSIARQHNPLAFLSWF